ncbi:MAG TPA: hypothetical protein VH684_07135 [Xanthobacteraceae bacterium]
MSLGLKPTDYLEMLKEEYAEYKADPVSMRKARLIAADYRTRERDGL